MLEQKLQEELNRYKAINRYGKTMIMEQDALGGELPPPADPAAAPADPAALPTDVPPADPAMDPMADAGAAPALPEGDTTEEIDITDLVDMTKSIKKDIETNKQDHGAVVSKMDDVFSKLNDLEAKLSQMDAVMAKIDQLGTQVQQMKPETPVEKLEMRSLDSYPFNEKPQEFFAHKQGEMRQSGKNEYILTKDEVSNYSPDQVKTSFNPTQDEYQF
jgi:polyhydroxyalkanoate synthesis regulator phasin